MLVNPVHRATKCRRAVSYLLRLYMYVAWNQDTIYIPFNQFPRPKSWYPWNVPDPASLSYFRLSFAIRKDEERKKEGARRKRTSMCDAFVEILVGWGKRDEELASGTNSRKVGGKDEINSRVYGTFKVAGISLTTWQSATVLASIGRLNSIDGSTRQTGAWVIIHFLSTRDSVNDSDAKLLRNF